MAFFTQAPSSLYDLLEAVGAQVQRLLAPGLCSAAGVLKAADSSVSTDQPQRESQRHPYHFGAVIPSLDCTL